MKLSEYLSQECITQQAFAELLGVTQGLVGFWVRGRKPTIERAIQIEKVTGGKVRCEDLRQDVDWAFLRGHHQEAA